MCSSSLVHIYLCKRYCYFYMFSLETINKKKEKKIRILVLGHWQIYRQHQFQRLVSDALKARGAVSDVMHSGFSSVKDFSNSIFPATYQTDENENTVNLGAWAWTIWILHSLFKISSKTTTTTTTRQKKKVFTMLGIYWTIQTDKHMFHFIGKTLN